MSVSSPSRTMASRTGFTVIELLVAVSVLSIIVYVLFSIFNQTQKALRGNLAQVDVLESGRAAMELLIREVYEMSPTPAPLVSDTELLGRSFPYQINFMSYLGPRNAKSPQGIPFPPQPNQAVFPREPFPPLIQELLTPPLVRVNSIQEMFFMTHQQRTWKGVGYRVLPDHTRTNDASWKEREVRSLYRFESQAREFDVTTSTRNPGWNFLRAVPTPENDPTNFFKIADGVVHFRATPLDFKGRPYHYQMRRTNAPAPHGVPTNLFLLEPLYSSNVYVLKDARETDTATAFVMDALPSYVDVELGILEPKVVDQYYSIPDLEQGRKFLEKQAGKVHLFRKRIPIRAGNR